MEAHTSRNWDVETDVKADPPSILFVVAKSRGHLNASFGLARCLQDLGYKAVYLCQREAIDQIDAQGFSVVSYTWLETLRLPLGISRRRFSGLKALRKWSETSEERIKSRLELECVTDRVAEIDADVAALMAEHAPCIVLFDPFMLAWSAPFISKGVSVAALSSKPFLNPNIRVPPYTSAAPIGNTLCRRICAALSWIALATRESAYSALELLVFGTNKFSALRNIGRLWGLDWRNELVNRHVYFDIRLRNVPELVLHSELFDFASLSKSSLSRHYLGPCIDVNRKVVAKVRTESTTICRAQTVLCVFSSVRHLESMPARMRLLDQILVAAQAMRSIEFLVTSSKTFDVAEFQHRAPANVRLSNDLDVLSEVKCSSVVLCLGGANIVKEAIAAGVPLLVYPDRADQPGVAARVALHQLGLSGNLRQTRAEHIVRSIDRLLQDPMFRSNCEAMSKEIAQVDTHSKLRDVFSQLRCPEG